MIKFIVKKDILISVNINNVIDYMDLSFRTQEQV